MIVDNQSKISKLSIKRFLMFNFTVYPLWIIFFLYGEELINILGSVFLFFLIIYLFFTTINWFFSQKRLGFIMLVISNVLGFIYFVYSINLEPGDILFFIPAALIIYPLFFIITLVFQVTTWIPFLLHFVYQNRRALDNLTWD